MAGHKRSAGDNDLVSSKKMAISDEMERQLHLPFEVNLRLYISDIANGVETRPIPCVNWIDDTPLPPFKYISTYITDVGVHVPTERGYMVCCDCIDGCVDSSSCPCRSLTQYEGKGLMGNNITCIGYDLKGRLMEQTVSGIYECNQYCTCNRSCSNRVVQLGVCQDLMVYKTENRGWGVMCLEDVPQGSFICCYIGQISTDEAANTRGIRLGDDYMAELDYIEVLELAKDNLVDNEIEFPFISLMSESSLNEDNSDYVVSTLHEASSSSSIASVNASHNDHHQCSPDLSCSDDKFSISLSPSNTSLLLNPSCRFYYHEDHCYIIDAKTYGNIGRFLNHSCSPNLFVQNVFVNSHDLRFPWVAFFAKTDIPAYTQLCWDYNYEVGSVKDKQIECLCGSDNCRKRLL